MSLPSSLASGSRAGVALARAPYIAERGASAYIGMGSSSSGACAATCGSACSLRKRSDISEVIPYRLALIGLGCALPPWRSSSGPQACPSGLAWRSWSSISSPSSPYRAWSEASTGWTLGSDLVPRGHQWPPARPRQAATTFASLLWFDLDYRDSPMPHQLEGTHGVLAGITPSPSGLVVATVVGIAAAFGHLDITIAMAPPARTRPGSPA